VVEALPIAAGDAPESNPLPPAGDAASRIHLSSSLSRGYPANFRFVKAFATKVGRSRKYSRDIRFEPFWKRGGAEIAC